MTKILKRILLFIALNLFKEIFGFNLYCQNTDYYVLGKKQYQQKQYYESILSFEKALTISKNQCYFNDIYNALIKIDKRIEFIKYSKQIFNSESKCKSINLINLGGAYDTFGDFDNANLCYDEAIKYELDVFNSGLINNNKGALYSKKGEYDLAIKNYEHAINKFKKSNINKDEITAEIANTLQNIGNAYLYKGNRIRSKYYYDLALFNFEKIKNVFDLTNNFINLYSSIGLFYLEIEKDTDKSDYYINEALKLQLGVKTKNEFQIARTKRFLGQIAVEKKELDIARKYLLTSLKVFENSPYPIQIILNLKQLGIVELKANNFLPALQNLQKALQYNSTNFKSDNIAENPKLETIKYKNDAIEIYKEKIIALLAIYKKEHKKEYLEYAISTINAVHELINYQRNSFQLEGSKLFLSEQAHTIYGLAIEAAYQKYVQTNDAKYIDLAFQYSEANKSVVLFESIKANEKSSFNGVPQTLIDMENKAIKNMAIYENQLYKDTKNEDLWRKKLIDVTDQLAKLKSKFKQEYPQYYNYKYNNEPIKIAELQSKLTVNQSVIEYFLNENTLFTFLVTKTGAKFIKQNLIVDFKSQMADFRNKLITKSIDESYQKLSFSIYNILFPAIISQILAKEKNNHLKIVADGILNQIPFESLLIKKPKSLKESNIYLLEKYVIGYLPSATMNWKQAQTKEATWWPISYLGFAPQYKNGLDLPVNQETVNYLANNLSGESYLMSSANIPNFEKYSKENTKILHLSMHGGASPTDPMESYLAFGADSLFAHDIYTKSIPTDLAILDACETGVGQINDGEGVLNLARAFLHAGGQAVAMSLWKLTSSAETAAITKDFAKLVLDGSAKDVALNTAKLNYLEKHRNDLQFGHPFYWSPLIVIGNTQAIEPSYFVYWLILMGLFCVYCYSSRRKV